MNKPLPFFITIFILLSTFLAQANNEESENKSFTSNANSPFSHLSVGLRVSTLGIGIEGATPLNDCFVFRGGVNFATYETKTQKISLVDKDLTLYNAFGYKPDYRMNGKINYLSAHTLVDYYPTQSIFHITGGFIWGGHKITANGYLTDPVTGTPATLKDPTSGWPSVFFEGRRLDLYDNTLKGELKLKQILKPYLGIGVGNAIEKNKRFAVKFEIGVVYQGNYTIVQDGFKIEDIENGKNNFSGVNTYTNLLKWWPTVNCQVTYRIF